MNYCAQIPLEVAGLPNPQIDNVVKKLNKYKVPHIIIGVELEGREYVRIEQVNTSFAKKEKKTAKEKRCTGIVSEPMENGMHIHKHPSGHYTECSFAWDEKNYWKIIREAEARTNKILRLGNYSQNSRHDLKKLPLKGELFINEGKFL
jgi:hypothetical protein